MKINKTYRSLLDKSINSMLSAIEIYNKPDFKYREETFAILAINAWELLFKARLLKNSNYNMNSIYKLEPKLKKDGTPSKINHPKTNRAGNPLTIGLPATLLRLSRTGDELPKNLIKSIRSLIELRDNAIHFHNTSDISKEIQELGFACVKNYMNLVKEWDLAIDLAQYNFYLMPLAYIDSKVSSDAILTEEATNYLNYLKKRVSETDSSDINYDIAIGIDINFKKATTLEGIGMRYDKDGVPIILTEEDITKKFPLSHDDVRKTANTRYADFKYNKTFHDIMKKIKENDKLCHTRNLDPNNLNSSSKAFYSSNVWQELDKNYWVTNIECKYSKT